MVEARLEQLDTGLAPVTDGWFVVNVPDAAWVTNKAFGAACILESDEVSFPHVGYTIAVLEPGQPNGMYHRESAQSAEAYAPYPKWQPGPPPNWAGTPWR